MLSTPAMKVVATAPRPGVSTPSFPSGRRIVARGVAVDDCTSVLSVELSVMRLTGAIEAGRMPRFGPASGRLRRGNVGEARGGAGMWPHHPLTRHRHAVHQVAGRVIGTAVTRYR